MTRNDLLQLLYYFEQAGIGLPRTEMFALMLSIREFVKKEPVASVRYVKSVLETKFGSDYKLEGFGGRFMDCTRIIW